MFHLIWMFIVGIVVGAIAKWIMPIGHLGWVMTGVLGIVGSFVGGFIARLFSKPAADAPIHPAGIVLSIVGAVIVLYLYRLFGLAG
ncbi:MAG: GlsB/YeaQ/YmgE family stress response membrane protein [Desulfovibrionaceae bacterium]|nr:GlsB/YeaQ/YmgE family stress response membrane protein [Desulfovibrionaceae bacterium]